MWYVFYDWVTAELEKIQFCIQSFSGILHTPLPETGWKIEHHVHVYSYLKPLIIIWVNVTHITHHYQYWLQCICLKWWIHFGIPLFQLKVPIRFRFGFEHLWPSLTFIPLFPWTSIVLFPDVPLLLSHVLGFQASRFRIIHQYYKQCV